MTLTPEQARHRLHTGKAQALGSNDDARVHAFGTAVFGISVGLFEAAQTVLTGPAGVVAATIFVAVCLAEGAWVERAARTVPRHAKRWARLGIGGSFALALFVVLPWLNLQARDESISPAAVLAGALVVALPSLVAAWAIRRRRT